MKMILLQDVKNYGKAGEVVVVSDGYGKNYLLPNKLAIMATTGALKINAHQKTKKLEQHKVQIQNLQIIKTQLTTIILQFKLKTNNGKVFGAVSAKQICEHLLKLHNIAIDKHKFVKFSPLHELGIKTINIKLDPTIMAQLKVEILGE